MSPIVQEIVRTVIIAGVLAVATVVWNWVRRDRAATDLTIGHALRDELVKTSEMYRKQAEACDRIVTAVREDNSRLRSQVTENNVLIMQQQGEIAMLKVKVNLLEARVDAGVRIIAGLQGPPSGAA